MLDELVVDSDGEVTEMNPEAENDSADSSSERPRERRNGKTGGKPDGASKGKPSGPAPWTPKGVVRDVDVLRTFLFALLHNAKKRQNPSVAHTLRTHFNRAMLALFTGLALLGWLVVVAMLGTFLGFVYLGIVGVVALVYTAKFLQKWISSPGPLPSMSTVAAFQTPGGNMLAAALGRVERERVKGTAWAVEWYRLFEEAFGTSVNPAMELPAAFVEESIAMERAKSESPSKTATKEAEQSSWSWRIPSVFSFIGWLVKLFCWVLFWGAIIYTVGLCLHLWTYERTLKPYMPKMSPYISAVEKSWEHRDRSTTELFPNGSPQGATGPSDTEHEKLLFSSPYHESTGSR